MTLPIDGEFKFTNQFVDLVPNYLYENIPHSIQNKKVISFEEPHRNEKIEIPQVVQKAPAREKYMQVTIKKDLVVKEWLLQDMVLNTFSNDILDTVKLIFQSTPSVEAYSVELVKEELPGMADDLTIYISLSKKVSKNEMMDLWKRISAKSIEIIRNITRNDHKFEEMLEKTTITVQRC